MGTSGEVRDARPGDRLKAICNGPPYKRLVNIAEESEIVLWPGSTVLVSELTDEQQMLFGLAGDTHEAYIREPFMLCLGGHGLRLSELPHNIRLQVRTVRAA